MAATSAGSLPYVALQLGAGTFVEALLDTGSTYTFVSADSVREHKLMTVPCAPLEVLLASGDRRLRIDSQVTLTFALGAFRASYRFFVLPAANSGAILGADFQREFQVVVNWSKGSIRLMDSADVPLLNGDRVRLSASLQIDESVPPHDLARVKALLEDKYFANDTCPFGRVHDHVHSIDTGDARPLYQAPRRESPSARATVREEVQKMLQAGAIRPSKSPWASPITLVPKKDGTTRFCIDFRRLNDVTVKDRHPLPRVDDMLEAMRGASYFTSLDAASGYWQIPVAPQDIPKTAFVCSEGLFEWTVMPFGLCNAPATYQRMMQEILSGYFWNFCVCYIDDILIYSKTFEEHLEHLRLVLKRVSAAGLLLKPSKCEFVKREINFLGHVVSGDGIRTDPKKIQKIENFPVPTSPTEVKSFLGLAGYYRRFIKDYSLLAAPLYDLTAKSAFTWGPKAEAAFLSLKKAMTTDVILRYPDFSRPFIVDCDASEIGMGAVLSQMAPDGERPIVMESRKFSPAEGKWHIREKEALAIKWGLEKFRHYLLGCEYVVRTDHSSLEWLLKAKSGRLQRWALTLQEFRPFTIIHRSGKTHANVDSLTRVFADSEVMADHMIFSLHPATLKLPSSEEIADAQRLDGGLAGWKAIAAVESRDDVLGMTEYGRWRPFLPKSLLTAVVRGLHVNPIGAHFGASRVRDLLNQHYIIRCPLNEIRDEIAKCEACARRKPIQPHGMLKSSPPDAPWRTVAMDFCGPYINSDGNRYVLV